MAALRRAPRAAAGLRGAAAHQSSHHDAGSRSRSLAVALIALAGLSSWWPVDDEADGATAAAVELEAGGRSVCGTLAEAQPGAVAVVTDGQRVAVSIAQLTALRPVDGC